MKPLALYIDSFESLRTDHELWATWDVQVGVLETECLNQCTTKLSRAAVWQWVLTLCLLQRSPANNRLTLFCNCSARMSSCFKEQRLSMYVL
ncbi:hypothetical protein FKM82_022093 [Ascaphus truei]